MEIDVDSTLNTLCEQISSYVHYINAKLTETNHLKIDWHGVSDACNDIRELVARIETWESVKSSAEH